jgi:flagellar hook-length control protein FliK
MNDVPVVAAPPARDHAPPDRGQEPAPSDAFAAALGAAQPAEAPPPPGDPTARTAPAEGTKAEGDSSGPDTRKTVDAGTPVVPAAALVVALPAAPAAPDAAPAASAQAQAAQVAAAPAAAVVPGAPAPQAPAAAPRPDGAPAAQLPAASDPDASKTAVSAPGAQTAVTAEPPAASSAPADATPADAPTPEAQAAPVAGEPASPLPAADGAQAEARPATPAVRTANRPAAGRTGRTEAAPARTGRAAASHAHSGARAGRAHDVPVEAAHGADTSAAAPAARPDDVPAAAHAPTQAETSVAGRAADPAPVANRAAPAQPAQDARPRVRVHDVPDVARATLRVAVRGNGSATARISLHPADLGGVRITMRVHDGAVAATLTAETEAAAQTLVQTASDLRRSLEGQGLQITSLDVHVAGDGPASSGDRRQASDLAQAMSSTDGTAPEDAVDITTELLHLVPLGTQVDVLA